MDKTTPCFKDVVLSICIVIMFLWCCFVHLYCDHVSLVLFCPSVSPVKHDHNTDGQKQHQRNMITIQMNKTTPEKHDHNTDGQKQHQKNMITPVL
jgi:hypothetical protein